jgi:hypothetical protein
MIERLARVRDEDLRGRHESPGARALLAAVTAEAVPAPRRRGRLALAAAGVLTAGTAIVAGPFTATTTYASSAIDVRLDGDFYVATIKDPLADHAAYAKAFDAVGLDVDLRLVPVPSQRVGRLFGTEGRGTGTTLTELIGPAGVDCAHAPAACTLVIRVSKDTDGPVRYTFGRAAEPGESYQEMPR